MYCAVKRSSNPGKEIVLYGSVLISDISEAFSKAKTQDGIQIVGFLIKKNGQMHEFLNVSST